MKLSLLFFTGLVYFFSSLSVATEIKNDQWSDKDVKVHLLGAKTHVITANLHRTATHLQRTTKR